MPVVLMILLFLFVPSTYGIASIFIPIMSILAVLLARLMYKKNMI